MQQRLAKLQCTCRHRCLRCLLCLQSQLLHTFLLLLQQLFRRYLIRICRLCLCPWCLCLHLCLCSGLRSSLCLCLCLLLFPVRTPVDHREESQRAQVASLLIVVVETVHMCGVRIVVIHTASIGSCCCCHRCLCGAVHEWRHSIRGWCPACRCLLSLWRGR